MEEVNPIMITPDLIVLSSVVTKIQPIAISPVDGFLAASVNKSYPFEMDLPCARPSAMLMLLIVA
ncbi:hypothetical protein Sjap_007723 [Stephania japonica]|uniref:Uncharacterized protein n=1 Tax=Stephania japonica TaxID=461633 RepID=A0AAP0JNJ2_9MAGN